MDPSVPGLLPDVFLRGEGGAFFACRGPLRREVAFFALLRFRSALGMACGRILFLQGGVFERFGRKTVPMAILTAESGYESSLNSTHLGFCT